mgnify:CR=1 FL=1
MKPSMKTYLPKVGELKRRTVLINAQGKILGRLATRVAKMLMGKDEVYYTPHMECGDQVIVINAKEIRVTGRKEKEKIYQHYTGYPGGRRTCTLEDLRKSKPELIITEAVRRMLPKNRLADKMLKRLRVYPGADHRQAAQQPELVEI